MYKIASKSTICKANKQNLSTNCLKGSSEPFSESVAGGNHVNVSPEIRNREVDDHLSSKASNRKLVVRSNEETKKTI